jgi:transposase
MSFIRKIKVGKYIYLAEVESIREGNKVRQKFIRYIGKEVNGKPTKRISTANIDKVIVKHHGQVQILKKLSEELQLRKHIPKELLTLVFSHLMESNLSINRLEKWVEKTSILDELELENFSTKRVYELLREFYEENFELVEEHLTAVFNKIETENEGILLDVTDTYFEGGKHLPWKRRKGKDGKIKKLVQIGLAITRKNGFPIHHKVYEGNIYSSKIFKDMAITLMERGIKSLTILGRGNHSAENIKLMKINGSQIILGMRKNDKLLSYIDKINRDDLYSKKHRVKLKKLSVFVTSFPYLDGRLIVIFNPSLEYAKRELMFEKEEENKNRITYAGFSLIYTDTNFKDEEIIKLYFERDMIEKAFRLFKGVISLRPIRVWLRERIIAHISLCYIAFALLSLLNYKVKPLRINGAKALEEIDGVYQIKILQKDGEILWEGLNEVKAIQKKIFDRV